MTGRIPRIDHPKSVAALYVSKTGPYPRIRAVEWWDEHLDATKYEGPYPVVAHPPCGPWGKLAKFCVYQRKDLAVIALAQVRKWNGVLEHPAYSRLWDECDMPKPGHGTDAWGGYTIEINQSDWGHVAVKKTWLYIVGAPESKLSAMPRPGRRAATATIRPQKGRKSATKKQRKHTPWLLALWLVETAARCAAYGDSTM